MQPPVRIAAEGSPAFFLRSLERRHAAVAALFSVVKPAALLPPRGPAVLLLAAQHLETATEGLDALLRRPDLRAALATHLVIGIDSCGEGYAVPPAMLAEWHAVLDRHGVPAGRVAHITHNALSEPACRAWLRASGRREGIRVLMHHPFLDRQADWMREALADPADRVARLQVALSAPAAVRQRARFLCLNNKPRLHRLALIGRLVRRGLLPMTLLSVAHATRPQREGDVTPGLAAAYEVLPRFTADLDAFATLLPRMPMAIPGDKAVRLVDIVHGVSLPLYRRALFSIVAETDFLSSDVARFTEKSVKALAGGHPAIIAGLPGTLRLLREAGFATFAPYIDEAYDAIDDPADRLEALLGEVERIARLSDAGTAALLRRCLPAVEHNLRHFAEGLPALLQRRLGDLAQALAWMAAPDPD